jgi:hypothetical protein
MIHLQPTNLFVIEVPFDAFNFKIGNNLMTGGIFHSLGFISINNFSIMESNTKIIGEIVRGDVLFDPDPYIEKWESVAKDGTMVYENYKFNGVPKCRDAKSSFLTLLESNDVKIEPGNKLLILEKNKFS